MRLTIESTGKLTRIEGVPVRVWEGTDEAGTKCLVFVRMVAFPGDGDCSQADRELCEQPAPRETFISLRHIL